MKNKSTSKSLLVGMFVITILAASNSIVRAQECPGTATWTGGTGDWFAGMNWAQGCIPTVNSDAFINNNGHAKIDGGGAGTAESLILGDNQGQKGSVTVTGDSAVLVVGPSSCRGDIYIGNRGSGNLTILNGGAVRNRYAYVAPLANPTGSRSSSYVTVASHDNLGYAWYLFDNEPQCTGAGLFIGCTADSNGVGGNATVNISDNSMIKIGNSGANPSVMVGLSGTLTGHGVIRMAQGSTVSKTVKVFGTLAPSGEFNPGLIIEGKLDLQLQANTVFHVNANGGYDTVYVTQNTGEGHAHLDGRVTVIMSGNFTPGTSFNLLHAEGGLDTSRFAFYSIISSSSSQCVTPTIIYPADPDNVHRDVYLSLKSCASGGVDEDP